MPTTTTTHVNSALASTIVILALAFWIVQIVSYWKVFAKAGRPGWLAIIPIVNLVVLAKIGKYSGWMVLLSFVPFVDIVWLFMLNIAVAKSFSKSAGFGVLMALIPIVGYPMLGFGAATYDASPKAA